MTVLIAQAKVRSTIETEFRVIVEFDKHDGFSTRVQWKNVGTDCFHDCKVWKYGRTKDDLRKCLRQFTRKVLDEHQE